MSARCFFLSVWLLTLVLNLSTFAVEEPTPQEGSTSKSQDPNGKEQVQIKKELQLLDSLHLNSLQSLHHPSIRK